MLQLLGFALFGEEVGFEFCFEGFVAADGAEVGWECVPDEGVDSGEVLHVVGDALAVCGCVSGSVVVDCCSWGVVVVVFWAIAGLAGVDIGVHFCAYSKGVEVGDVEDVEFCHDGFGVGVRFGVVDEADDALLCFD